MYSILQKEDAVLRKVAKDVPIKDIKSKKIQQLLVDMRAALDAEIDGVGLAAPQIGESLRIFIISELAVQRLKAKPSLVYINPVIVRASKEKKDMEEGCLSVRPYYGNVKRSTKVTIRAYDQNGVVFERGGSGLLAHIFQHETDHLDGILFIDKAKDVYELPPEEFEEMKNRSGEALRKGEDAEMMSDKDASEKTNE